MYKYTVRGVLKRDLAYLHQRAEYPEEWEYIRGLVKQDAAALTTFACNYEYFTYLSPVQVKEIPMGDHLFSSELFDVEIV